MMAARNEFVKLPNTQDHWKDLKVELANLAEKKVKGLEAFEKVLSENDHWQSVSTPFTLLRQVLSRDQHFSEEYFCETLLPWIANKALQVEKLFKDSVSGYKLPVSRTLLNFYYIITCINFIWNCLKRSFPRYFYYHTESVQRKD